MFTGSSIELHDTDKYQPIQVKTTFLMTATHLCIYTAQKCTDYLLKKSW